MLCAGWVAEHPSACTARAAVDRVDVQRGEEEKVKSSGTVPSAGPVSAAAPAHITGHTVVYAWPPGCPRPGQECHRFVRT